MRTGIIGTPKISRGLAFFILACVFASIFMLFGALHYTVGHARFRRCLAALAVGAHYLDEQGVLRQNTSYDCGPVSLAMVLADTGYHVPEETLLKTAHTSSRGTTMLNLQQAARAFGANAASWQLTYADLQCVPKPAIAFVNNDHFLVVDDVTRSRVVVRDPAHGRLVFPAWVFNRFWQGQTIIFGDSKLPCSVPSQASSENRRGIRK